MKAIVIERFGGIETLVIKDLEIPAIHKGEVLVKTKAIGVNPIDCKARHGKAVAEHLTLPIILGRHFAPSHQNLSTSTSNCSSYTISCF